MVGVSQNLSKQLIAVEGGEDCSLFNVHACLSRVYIHMYIICVSGRKVAMAADGLGRANQCRCHLHLQWKCRNDIFFLC